MVWALLIPFGQIPSGAWVESEKRDPQPMFQRRTGIPPSRCRVETSVDKVYTRLLKGGLAVNGGSSWRREHIQRLLIRLVADPG